MRFKGINVFIYRKIANMVKMVYCAIDRKIVKSSWILYNQSTLPQILIGF